MRCGDLVPETLGNEKLARSFFNAMSHEHRRIQVMDIRPDLLVFFPGFEGSDRSCSVLTLNVRQRIGLDVRGVSGPRTYSGLIFCS